MATDYISRQAAINIVCDDECDDCPDGGCDMYRRLKRFPAADVRPVVRGKWECADDEDFSQPHVRCSNCGEYYFAWYRKFPFCPNCGADMRGKCND